MVVNSRRNDFQPFTNPFSFPARGARDDAARVVRVILPSDARGGVA
jgi:hypothetical protein